MTYYITLPDLLHKEAKAKGNAQFVEKLTFCTFDGFQTKPLWKLVILEKLLLLKVFFTLLIKTHNYFFCDSAFQHIHETNINRWCLGVTQKCELCVSFKRPVPHFKETVFHQIKTTHFKKYLSNFIYVFFLNSCVLCHCFSFIPISFVNVYLHGAHNVSINKQHVFLNFPIKSFSYHLYK